MAPIVPTGRTGLAGLLPAALDAVAGRPNALRLPQRRGVVLLLVDGLGSEALAARAGHARVLSGAPRIDTGVPTTTAAALTTLATGRPPGEHGVVGYTALDPERDRVVNQLRGFDQDLPDDWQRSGTVFERAAEEGMPAFAVGPRHYAGSGFTRQVLRGARYVGARTMEDRLTAAVDATADGGIAYCYVPELDVAAHRDGWRSGAWTDALETLDGALSTALAGLRRGRTLLVTADHGILDVPEQAHVVLEDVPGLLDGVRHLAGEPRLLHVHLQPDADPGAHADRWRDALGARAQVLTRAEAVEAGWFGPVDPVVAPRIGDLLVAASGRTACYRAADDPGRGMVGQHGSWTPAERFVPLARFDG
ncbi:alkaline phosphatase family protein [Amnibacterium endophyticum]|uniref:Alkaline phosphatase family protein n=1 Tax=Amnibacterium endophyticum TaxID=2109337 RepID=A0ABW4LKA7_9MICO